MGGDGGGLNTYEHVQSRCRGQQGQAQPTCRLTGDASFHRSRRRGRGTPGTRKCSSSSRASLLVQEPIGSRPRPGVPVGRTQPPPLDHSLQSTIEQRPLQPILVWPGSPGRHQNTQDSGSHTDRISLPACHQLFSNALPRDGSLTSSCFCPFRPSPSSTFCFDMRRHTGALPTSGTRLVR